MRSSPVKCEARMALPASSARKAAATSIWPAWRLSAWMRASNGVSDPRAPSVDNAPVAKAERNSVSALNRPMSALAVENCVPLRSASPSLGCSAIGSRPTSVSAAWAGAMRSPTRAWPTPIIAAAIWASGARSPDAPTDPCEGTTGVTPRASIASMSSSVRGLDARRALREAAELQRHHQPRRCERKPVRRRPRRARARCCAEAAQDHRVRSARPPVCRSRC